MFGPDVVVPEPAGFIHGELDYPLGAQRQAKLFGGRGLAATDDELDGGTNSVDIDAEAIQDPRRDALTLTDEPEQEVLGA